MKGAPSVQLSRAERPAVSCLFGVFARSFLLNGDHPHRLGEILSPLLCPQRCPHLPYISKRAFTHCLYLKKRKQVVQQVHYRPLIMEPSRPTTRPPQLLPPMYIQQVPASRGLASLVLLLPLRLTPWAGVSAGVPARRGAVRGAGQETRGPKVCVCHRLPP